MSSIKDHKRFALLVLSLSLFFLAISYLIWGLTRKCGGFEGISCPRGFKCDLSEKPGYVVYGKLDRCVIRLGK